MGIAAGLDAVGVCQARSWESVRRRLEATRSSGRSDTMAFTFRNPARSSDPSRILRNARSLVVAALDYSASDDGAHAPERPAGAQARVARYATVDHYARLESALAEVAGLLRSRGHRAVVMCDDNSVVDREAAWRAGLGWYGKNSNILLPGRGSWFVLGSVVTDAPLDTTGAPVADGCASCRRCLDGCPTGAIVAPGMVDARRCLSWLLQRPGDFPVEYRVALGDRIYGCDDCQEVCPPNRRQEVAVRVGIGAGAGAGAGGGIGGGASPWRDVCDLLELSDAELLERCDRWYIPDRDPGIVRRNLYVVLGNVTGPEDHRALAAIERGRRNHDPMLARHADWAADQVALRAAQATDSIIVSGTSGSVGSTP